MNTILHSAPSEPTAHPLINQVEATIARHQHEIDKTEKCRELIENIPVHWTMTHEQHAHHWSLSCLWVDDADPPYGMLDLYYQPGPKDTAETLADIRSYMVRHGGKMRRSFDDRDGTFLYVTDGPCRSNPFNTQFWLFNAGLLTKERCRVEEYETTVKRFRSVCKDEEGGADGQPE